MADHHKPTQSTSQPHGGQVPNAPAFPGTEKAAVEKKKDDEAKDRAEDAKGLGKKKDESSKDAAGQTPPEQPASAKETTRQRQRDEAGLRQTLRQSGVGGQHHDELVDLAPALEEHGMDFAAACDLVKEFDRGAMETLKRVFAAKK